MILLRFNHTVTVAILAQAESLSIRRPVRRNLFHPPGRDIPSKKMAQIDVGDLVLVHGLMNQKHYNGCQGIVTQLIVSNPDNKCEIWLVSEGRLEGKQLLLKMQPLILVARRGYLA